MNFRLNEQPYESKEQISCRHAWLTMVVRDSAKLIVDNHGQGY